MFHVARKDIAGKTDHDLFPKERADAFRFFDQQVLAAGRALESEESVPQDDGPHTYISVKAPLLDERDTAYAVCGISSDITGQKQLQEQLRELAQRLINAQEEERARIARELHDDVGQQINSLSLCVDDLRRRISERQQQAREQASRIHNQVVQLAAGIRNLSHELHPTILELVGLPAALRIHCGEFSSQADVSVSFEANDSFDDLPSPIALCIYRVVHETCKTSPDTPGQSAPKCDWNVPVVSLSSQCSTLVLGSTYLNLELRPAWVWLA